MRVLEPWQRLSVTQRRVALTLSVLAGVWLIESLGLGPLRRQIRQLRQQVQDTEQRLARAVSVSAHATTIRTAFEAYRPYVPATSPALNDAVRVQSQVQSEVEAAVRVSGINLLNVKPVSTGTREVGSTVSVALELETTPEQLITLLDSVQRSTQLLKVTHMALRLTDEHAATLRCSMMITKLLLSPLSLLLASPEEESKGLTDR